MAAAPDISVIIPAYGRAVTLERAIQSVASQDVSVEIIIIDDASPEPLSVPQGGMPLRLVRREVNGGAGAARNTGLELATGRLVTFLDSDDIMLPQTLGRRILAADARGAREAEPLAVGCGWLEVTDGKVTGGRIPREPVSSLDFAGGCWVNPGSAVIFNRAALDSAGGFDEGFRRLEDVDFFLRFAEAGGRFATDANVAVAVTQGAPRNAAAIREAVARLRAGHGATLPKPFRAKLGAYLDLELARLARQEGRPVAMLTHLVASFIAMPRLRLNTGPGWDLVDHAAFPQVAP